MIEVISDTVCMVLLHSQVEIGQWANPDCDEELT